MKNSIRLSLTRDDAAMLRNVIESYRVDLVDPENPDELSVEIDGRLKAIADRLWKLI